MIYAAKSILVFNIHRAPTGVKFLGSIAWEVTNCSNRTQGVITSYSKIGCWNDYELFPFTSLCNVTLTVINRLA